MIGWILVGVVGAALVGAAVCGLVMRCGRADFIEALGKPFFTLGIWLIAMGVLVDDILVDQSALSMVVGAGVGLLVFLLFLGWDEAIDLAMPGFYACLRREIYAFFATPIPYFVLFLFVALSGYFFWSYLSQQPGTEGHVSFALQALLSSLAFFGIFLFPLLTMGLFSKERSEGTIEVLMTAPISDVSVTVAKFLAAMTFYAAMLAPTAVYCVILFYIGRDIHQPAVGTVLTSYLGLFLYGALFISLGMFASSLTSSQILAALLTWVLIIFLLVSTKIADMLDLTGTWMGSALDYLNPGSQHLPNLVQGVIEPTGIMYFLSFTAFFLFLSVRSIESRKWR